MGSAKDVGRETYMGPAGYIGPAIYMGPVNYMGSADYTGAEDYMGPAGYMEPAQVGSAPLLGFGRLHVGWRQQGPATLRAHSMVCLDAQTTTVL